MSEEILVGIETRIETLSVYASLWYDNLKHQRLREGKESIKSWSKLKRKLLDKFVTKDYTQDMFIKLYKLRQDERPLETYLREFEQLTLQCEINEKLEQRIFRLLEGLDKNIATKVRIQPLWSYDDVVNLALRVEKMGKSKPASPKSNTKPVFKPYTSIRFNDTSKTTIPTTSVKGKVVATSKPTQPPTENRIKCFQCQGYGHFKKDCPSKRVMTSIEVEEWERDGLVEYEREEVIEGEAEEEEPSQDAVIANLDTGHSLVLWRVMNSQQAPLDEDQRSLIFRSRCTIQERVCNLIIDGGSCTNMTYVTLVEKLNLNTQAHPLPYKLRWLNKGADVKVDMQCLIPFSIGKVYKDEVLYNVVPMDACHLLLGRPWEFGKSTVHHGRNNTYTFKQGSKKITLTPLPPNQKIYGSPSVTDGLNGVLFLLEAEMEISEAEKSQIPMEVQKLLEGYSDVFPEELPSGLPPLRGIKHQIDLVPGSIIPNILAYKSDPTTTKELKSEIEELMAKGFVIESLSPCVVPALLVPKKDGSWRICIDSKAINNKTVKYRFSITRLDDMLDELSGS
ncbi:uncharacterized protein LOC141607684 [Silene latifolia]|uniref:uncharacterized protein LOC141607684 n=1 Tax=Silene latifolia TaxID=37657 RepID=UPI003D785849